MNEQRISDETLAIILEGWKRYERSRTGFGAPKPSAKEEVALLRELQERRAQRCETCGNGAETLGPPFDSVGCNEHQGWWPKDGYCHLWRAKEETDD